MKHIRAITVVIEHEVKYLNEIDIELKKILNLKECGIKTYGNYTIDEEISRLEEYATDTRNIIFHLNMRLKFYVS